MGLRFSEFFPFLTEFEGCLVSSYLSSWKFYILFFCSNEDLVMPPKPLDMRKKLAFYNIDFSLEHQVNLKGSDGNYFH